MSKFVKYKLKDGRQVRGRYNYDTDKVLISREDLDGLLNESDVSYEQAKQLQTIIGNLDKIRAEAVGKALDKIRAEIEQLIEWHDCPVEYDNGNDYWYCQALNTVLQIIDKYRKE